MQATAPSTKCWKMSKSFMEYSTCSTCSMTCHNNGHLLWHQQDLKWKTSVRNPPLCLTGKQRTSTTTIYKSHQCQDGFHTSISCRSCQVLVLTAAFTSKEGNCKHMLQMVLTPSLFEEHIYMTAHSFIWIHDNTAHIVRDTGHITMERKRTDTSSNKSTDTNSNKTNQEASNCKAAADPSHYWWP